MTLKQYSREEILDYLRQKGDVTPYSTQDILLRIEVYVRANGSTIGLSFAKENLAGIDLSQETIRQEFKRQGFEEQNPPLWYSGDLKQAKLRKKPDIIASAREPSAVEVASKQAINLEGVDFSKAILVGANFEGADLSQANFDGARLQHANLRRARLWDANFCRARLNQADLTGAALQNADLSWATLRGATLDRCLLFHVHLEKTEMEREQVNEIWEERRAKEVEKERKDARRHYADAATAYNRLKNNFASIGKHNDAGWAFIKEKRMGRKTHRILSREWTINQFMDITCGYGEQPWKVFIIALAAVVGFGFIYWGLGGIGSTCWSDNFVFSLRSFVTMAFSDLSPTTLTVKILSAVEAAFGVSLFALLMYSLGRRMTGY
jgi:uncharacterized protein YjbI with pentapeptide repeats